MVVKKFVERKLKHLYVPLLRALNPNRAVKFN